MDKSFKQKKLGAWESKLESFGTCRDHLLVVTRVTLFNRCLDTKHFLRPRNVKHFLNGQSGRAKGILLGELIWTGLKKKTSTYFAYFIWCIITLSHTLGVSSLQTRFRNIMTYEFYCFRTFKWWTQKNTYLRKNPNIIYQWKINCDYETSNQNLPCIKKVIR